MTEATTSSGLDEIERVLARLATGAEVWIPDPLLSRHAYVLRLAPTTQFGYSRSKSSRSTRFCVEFPYALTDGCVCTSCTVIRRAVEEEGSMLRIARANFATILAAIYAGVPVHHWQGGWLTGKAGPNYRTATPLMNRP